MHYVADTSTGITICPICHFQFVPSIVGDISWHRKYHRQYISGIKVNDLLSDKVIFDNGNRKILIVTPESSAIQRNRAERVARRAKIGTNYDFLSYHADEISPITFTSVFIEIVKSHAISMLVLRKISCSTKIDWETYNNYSEAKMPLDQQTRWCIGMIWTLEKERRKGHAKLLINEVSNYSGNPITEFVWSIPFSDTGIKLARSISPHEIRI